jgi:molybdate transport system ATP-binding protein
VIDVQLQLTLREGQRRFDLDLAFASEAPVVALYGPSGAGKSLTLQAMAGLLRPAAGHVRVAGKTLFDSQQGLDLPAAQRHFGYVFQSYALFPHLTVRENVAFGLRSAWRPWAKAEGQRTDELLEAFGLASLARSLPRHLSGGQQQRVALARALAPQPRALLLDEPFAALHPALRQELREELKTMRGQWGVPIVLITHDVDDVLALAQVAYRLEAGQIVQEVNLETETRRNFAQRLISPGEPPEQSPHEARLRQLLEAEDAASRGG